MKIKVFCSIMRIRKDQPELNPWKTIRKTSTRNEILRLARRFIVELFPGTGWLENCFINSMGWQLVFAFYYARAFFPGLFTVKLRFQFSHTTPTWQIIPTTRITALTAAEAREKVANGKTWKCFSPWSAPGVVPGMRGTGESHINQSPAGLFSN